MIIWVDAHLSPGIATWISQTFSITALALRSDLSGSKVRPAVIINTPHTSQDIFIVPLTSKIASLLVGEFVLSDSKGAGLNVETAVKRGLYTVQQSLVVANIGRLTNPDIEQAIFT